MALLTCIRPRCLEVLPQDKIACEGHWEEFPFEVQEMFFEAWLRKDWNLITGLAEELKHADTRDRPRHPG